MKFNLKNTSFFSKQLFATLGVNFLSLAVVVSLLYSNVVDDYKNDLVNMLQSQSTLLAEASSSSLLFDDVKSANELLNSINNLSGTRFASLYKSDFTLFASFQKDDSIDVPEINKNSKFGAIFVDDNLFYLMPVEFYKDTIGYLLLSSDTKHLEEQQARFVETLLVVLVISMVVSYLLLWRLQKTISKPISKLVSLVRYVSSTRTYNRRLDISSGDELGELGKGVNSILDTVETHQEQLNQHNQELEELVRLRTTQLYQRANFDGLTSLSNRHTFIERLEKEMLVAGNEKCELAVMFLDLDRFKIINDSLGHAMGDRVLIEVADRLTKIITNTQNVCRWGGDEFVILITNICDRNQVNILATRIIESLSQTIFIDSQALHVSTCIGIAMYPEHDTDASALLKYADTSMYDAKSKGHGKFSFFDNHMLVTSRRKLSMENKIRSAIENDSFTMVYQPQFAAKTGELHGVEALIRWKDEGKYISPAEFIPTAEEAGLINQLSMWVIKHVCMQISEWKRLGLKPVTVAINLPGSLIGQQDCLDILKSVLTYYDISPSLLEIEITENMFIASTDLAVDNLLALKQFGFVISIDDFGTGYSCMSYLSNLPIDKLKIDGGFIRKLGKEKANDGIVQAIMTLAKSLNLITVAECVETQQELETLKALDCDIIQGYLFSKPLPPDEVSTHFK
ncbi:EAL domain-containing protein [Paraglaciecola sp. 2405UD69-4]|uniref:EAL domain-containing protein n=1 Tax=Paraglaciecola sp. 2405UD69-4 TaxID=3391836 RepID=UPI0039C8CE4B